MQPKTEKWSKGLATRISEELKYSKEQEAVIAYGLFAIIHTFLGLMMTIVGGMIFGLVLEAVIVSLGIVILRKSTGGAHLGQPGLCNAVGMIVAVGIALILSGLTQPTVILGLQVIGFVVSYMGVMKFAPVDHPAKPIRTEEKRQKLKKKSLLTLHIYLLGTVIAFVMYSSTLQIKYIMYSLYLTGGMVWQIFTLTSAGNKLMKRIDFFYIKYFDTEKEG